MDNNTLDDLVSEVMGEVTPVDTKEDHSARLEAFSSTLKVMRKAAIDARRNAGIDDQWREDDEFYEGIDAANRSSASHTKPYDFGGTGTGPTLMPQKTQPRSTVFVPLTRPYVDIAAARISDMYMPTDDRNWDGEPTPIPDLVKALEDQTPVSDPSGQPVPGQPAPVMGQGQPIVGEDGQPILQPQPMKVADKAQQIMDEANECWKKARTQIDDWLKECSYNGELRKAIHDMARIGTGIIKGPFPKSKISKAVTQINGGFGIEAVMKISPTTVRVDPYRFFPAAEVGEEVAECSHVFEQDFITRSKLRNLKAEGLGYLADQVEKCLEEGPISSTTGTKKNNNNQKSEADLFEIWYFEGQVEWQDLQDAGCDCQGKKGDVFHALVTMVNERVVKASLHHLDSGEFTYDIAIWQRKAGTWIGDGVGRQGRTAQNGVNAAVRNLMDNAGQSSRPHKVINRAVIKQGSDPWTWTMEGDADLNDVSHAMMFFNVPSMQVELMNIIQYFQKMFEDSTGLPMILQGQQGSAPETVGGMEMLQNNAGIVPRNIVRMLDDHFTEPHIKRYYEYLLIHGEDESAKGDFNIHARGSSALMERASQDQFLISLGEFVMNPAFEIDPILYIEEVLKSKRINPERLKLSEERKKELAQRQAPEDPRITAAKIMAQGSMGREQLKAKEMADHAAADAALEMNRQQFEASESEKERQNRLAISVIDERMKSTELTSAERQTLDKIKAQLAGKSMDLTTQTTLSREAMAQASDHATAKHAVDVFKHRTAPQVARPSIEPAGRAPNGEAFIK